MATGKEKLNSLMSIVGVDRDVASAGSTIAEGAVANTADPSLPSFDDTKLDTILASLTTEDPGSQLQQTLSAFLGTEVPLDGAVESLANTIATKIGLRQNKDAAYVLSKVVILETFKALEIGAGFTSANLTGFQLAKIQKIVEDIQKKLNIVLDSPLKLALESYWSVLNNFRHGQISTTLKEAEKMIDHARHALTYIIPKADGFDLPALRDASVAATLAMMGEVMRTSFDEEKKTIQPFYLLTKMKKSLIVNEIERRVKEIVDFGEKMEKSSWFLTKKKSEKKQDAVDAVLKLAYPYLTEGKGLTDTLAVIKAPYSLNLMPKFLPDGKEDRTSFVIGREDGKSRSVKAWRKDGKVWVMNWEDQEYYTPYIEEDEVVQLSPSYPSSLTLSTTSQDIHEYVRDSCQGVYKRETGLSHHGRPVWRMTGGSDTCYLYYSSDGYWRISSDYKSDMGTWIQSEQSGLESVPETGWQVLYGGWKSEPGMRVVAQ